MIKGKTRSILWKLNPCKKFKKFEKKIFFKNGFINRLTVNISIIKNASEIKFFLLEVIDKYKMKKYKNNVGKGYKSLNLSKEK